MGFSAVSDARIEFHQMPSIADGFAEALAALAGFCIGFLAVVLTICIAPLLLLVFPLVALVAAAEIVFGRAE